jgi:rhodanese-related sulfurtransferase
MIKKIVGVVLLGSLLFAKVTNIPATTAFIEQKKMKIIDIRTKGEWVQMGIIKDAHLITFFDERYGYDTKSFLEELNHVVKKDEQFAIICNTGSRTKLISNFLGNKLDYNVVNLTGGMVKLLQEGFKPTAYNTNSQNLPIELTHPSSEMLQKEAELTTPIEETNSSK